MDNIDVYLIFDGILVLLGIVLIFSDLKMKAEEKISTMLLSQEEQKKIKDPKPYIAFMFPRMMVFSIVSTLLGVLGVLYDLKILVIPYWGLVEMIVFLVVFLIFFRFMRTARERYL